MTCKLKRSMILDGIRKGACASRIFHVRTVFVAARANGAVDSASTTTRKASRQARPFIFLELSIFQVLGNDLVVDPNKINTCNATAPVF